MSEAVARERPPDHPVTRLEQAAKQLELAAQDERVSVLMIVALGFVRKFVSATASHLDEELDGDA